MVVNAQIPEKMSYQAIIRSSSGELVTNKTIRMRISILQGSADGTVVFDEVQSPVTNAIGMVGVEIGGGIGTNGSLSGIDWANGPYFIKCETDPDGGSNYTITGISQLLSVPYTLHAKTAERLIGDITETDPVFNSSAAASITAIDTARWNAKIGNYTETQNLADVVAKNNSANGQIKNLVDPTDSQDVATKKYVDEVVLIIRILNSGVSDVDGNHYNAVIIGNQVWMASNLKTSRYIDRTVIPYVTDAAEWKSRTAPAYCWYNNDSATFSNPYGALYNWYTIETGNLCPIGWHVPAHEDWTDLINYLGGENIAGGKLKETATAHWLSPNTGATNESGFTAVPGGYRSYYDGNFDLSGTQSYYWSSTPLAAASVLFLAMFYNLNAVNISDFYKTMGMSVRCLLDINH